MRDSFIFYRSFKEALDDIDDFPVEEQLKAYKAICNYAFEEELPTEKGIASAILKLVKPQIDANNKRYENGKKGAEYGKLGGRPKKKTEENPIGVIDKNPIGVIDKNPIGDITENPTQTPNVNVNVNVNDNVNENVNENVNVNANKNISPELSKDTSEPAAVEAIPLNDNSEWKATKDYIDEMERLYPSVDVEKEFRKIRAWCLNNPSRRKTKTGVKRFVNNWLSKAQNQGGHICRPVAVGGYDWDNL